MTVLERDGAIGVGIYCPKPPRSVDDLGLPFNVVVELALKVLYFNGSLHGRELAAHLHVPFSLVEPALKVMADAGYCSSAGMRGGVVLDNENVTAAVQWVLSQAGRQRVRELLEVNQYAGPVPVPVDVYAAVARLQTPDLDIREGDLRRVLAHLVLGDDVLESLGPAINARHTIFLYGPPGNGKTSIADACSELLGPPLFVPHALYAHGEVIRFFDPIYHIPAHPDELPPHDQRWVCVQRPEVKVGGELGPHSLELSFDRRLGFYEASAQLKANGGLFLVDDFGRQTRVSATELLNRLIVPLEKGVDYINVARAGTTIAVPFTTTLVLSTNLMPEDLMDEALLRRVRFKVLVGGPDEDQYKQIWRDLCHRHDIEYRARVVDSLVERQYRRTGAPFRGVHPRDLLSHIASAARYRGRPVELTPELMQAACRAYFVRRPEEW